MEASALPRHCPQLPFLCARFCVDAPSYISRLERVADLGKPLFPCNHRTQLGERPTHLFMSYGTYSTGLRFRRAAQRPAHQPRRYASRRDVRCKRVLGGMCLPIASPSHLKPSPSCYSRAPALPSTQDHPSLLRLLHRRTHSLDTLAPS